MKSGTQAIWRIYIEYIVNRSVSDLAGLSVKRSVVTTRRIESTKAQLGLLLNVLQSFINFVNSQVSTSKAPPNIYFPVSFW